MKSYNEKNLLCNFFFLEKCQRIEAQTLASVNEAEQLGQPQLVPPRGHCKMCDNLGISLRSASVVQSLQNQSSTRRVSGFNFLFL